MAFCCWYSVRFSLVFYIQPSESKQHYDNRHIHLPRAVGLYLCVCMYVRMYVYMYVCMYVCIYHIRFHVLLNVILRKHVHMIVFSTFLSHQCLSQSNSEHFGQKYVFH